MPRSAFAKAPAAAPAVTLGREECSVSWQVVHKAWGLDRRTHWRDNACFLIQWFNKTTCGFRHKRWRQWSFFAIRRCGMCEATVLNTKTCLHRHSDPELQCLFFFQQVRDWPQSFYFPPVRHPFLFYGALQVVWFYHHFFSTFGAIGYSRCISHQHPQPLKDQWNSSQVSKLSQGNSVVSGCWNKKSWNMVINHDESTGPLQFSLLFWLIPQ